MSDGSLLVDQENKETLEDIVWKENEEVIIFSNELIKCYHFKENNFEESNDMYFPVDGSNNRITGIWNFQQNNFIAYVPQVGKEKFLCSKKTEPKNLKEIFHNIDSLPIQWAYLDVKGFARIKTEKSDYVIKMD